MAKILDKTNILLGNTILPGDISQSIDAFTGQEEYDVSLSGSFSLTGSLYLDNIPTSSTSVNLLTIDPITKQVQQTSSFDPGSSINTGSFIINATNQLNQIEFTQGDGTQFTTDLEVDNLKQQEFQTLGSTGTSTHTTKTISGVLEFTNSDPSIESDRFNLLTGKTLGVDAFITTTIIYDPNLTPGNSPYIYVRNISNDGEIEFFRDGVSVGERFMFIGTIIV